MVAARYGLEAAPCSVSSCQIEQLRRYFTVRVGVGELTFDEGRGSQRLHVLVGSGNNEPLALLKVILPVEVRPRRAKLV
jgi:hypothetical protein